MHPALFKAAENWDDAKVGLIYVHNCITRTNSYRPNIGQTTAATTSLKFAVERFDELLAAAIRVRARCQSMRFDDDAAAALDALDAAIARATLQDGSAS